MSKTRPDSPVTRTAAGGAARGSQAIPVWLRIVVTVLLMWHLTAIFMAAMSVPGSSELADYVAQATFMQKYLDALHINQGHAFFAPDPPNPVYVQYEILDNRGSVIKRGEFPNTQEQWPRLYYHRYFMLADQAGSVGRNEQEMKQWSQKFLTNYARNLLRQSDGASIRAQRVLQELVSPDELLKGKKLKQGEYRVIAEVTQTRRDLAAEDAAPVTLRDSAGWTSGGRR